MLVGGLSKSEYAYDRIHDGYAAKRMKVCRAEDAWTAVSQGARYTVSRLALYIRDCLDGIMAFSIVSVCWGGGGGQVHWMYIDLYWASLRLG